MHKPGTPQPWAEAAEIAPGLGAVTAALSADGLDLHQVFDGSRYNAAVADHPALAPLPVLDRAHPLALLIGNTRALWPRLLRALRDTPALRRAADPVDTWTTAAVHRALRHLTVPFEVRLAHEGGRRLVSMLHAAEVSGLATRGPAHLAVHPEHGPWIGLRAVVVVDAELPTELPALPAVCDGCAAPCVPALATALATDDGAPRVVERHWSTWLRVREVCPVGRASRYSSEQARYHYTKDRARLHALAEGRDLPAA